MRRFLWCVVVLAGVLLLPSPAWAADGLPAAFAGWSPNGVVEGVWSPYRSGADTFDKLCPGGFRSWSRPDGVVVVVDGYTCADVDLPAIVDNLLQDRTNQTVDWQKVPSALPNFADHAGSAGGDALFRSWIQDPYEVNILVNCPAGSVSRATCVDLSTAAVRSVSAALPGQPHAEPAPTVSEPLCCAPSRTPDGVAADNILAAWRPEKAVGDAWAERRPAVIWVDSWTPIVCSRSTNAWRLDNTVVFLQWWTCDNDDQVAAFARRGAVQVKGRWADVAPALGPYTDNIMEIAEPGWTGHMRSWSQGHVGVSVGILCGQLSDSACAQLSAKLVQNISGQLPGDVVGTNTMALLLWHDIAVGLIIVGAINVIVRFGQRMGNVSWSVSSSGPHWHNISAQAQRAEADSLRLYAADAATWLGVAAIAVGGLSLLGPWRLALPAVVALLVAGLLALRWARRIRRPRLAVQYAAWRRRYRLPRARLTPKRLLGVVVMALGGVVGIAFITVWLSAAWVHAGGDLGSPRFKAINDAQSFLHVPTGAMVKIDLFIGTIGYLSDWQKGWFLLSGLTIAIVVVRIGLRLSARSLEEMRSFDNRPPLLLLRNFKDDRINIPASRLSHAGFLGATFAAVTNQRSQRFQELLTRQLTEIGPVIAVAPRHTIVASIGAAQASYSDQEWQDEVEKKAKEARAVVFLAAPPKINESLFWELELAATRMGHQRVILVIPPRPPAATLKERLFGATGDRAARRVLAGWQGFRDRTAVLPLFTPLSEGWIPDGAQILVHHPIEGWHAWGGEVRTDWSYAIAIHEIAEFIETAWPADANAPIAAESHPAS